MEKSNEKLPKSAMALYVKLYCKKHESSKNRQYILMEATKSWVSLSKPDKKYFFKILKEYDNKIKKYFASNLQNAQLYMNKNPDRPQRLFKKEEEKLPIDCDQNSCEEHNIHKENSSSNNVENNENVMQHCDDQLENYTKSTYSNLGSHIKEANTSRHIVEPIPPIRSSMELFEIIKNNEDGTRNLKWEDLTKSQKRRYQRAVLNIKTNYLKQYIAYLESLTPKQLFSVYKSRFDGT